MPTYQAATTNRWACTSRRVKLGCSLLVMAKEMYPLVLNRTRRTWRRTLSPKRKRIKDTNKSSKVSNRWGTRSYTYQSSSQASGRARWVEAHFMEVTLWSTSLSLRRTSRLRAVVASLKITVSFFQHLSDMMSQTIVNSTCNNSRQISHNI